MNDEHFDPQSQLVYDSITELIPLSKEGDRVAQQELLKQMQGYLTLMAEKRMDPALAAKIGASDVVQQTLTQVVAKFDQFRGTTAAEFRGWLKTIVTHEVSGMRRAFYTAKRNINRERSNDNHSATDSRTGPKDQSQTPSSEAISNEQVAIMYRILDQLPEDYSQVIRLRSLEQLPFSQIAEKMNRSLDSVTKLFYRAVLKFEELLTNSSDFDQPGQ